MADPTSVTASGLFKGDFKKLCDRDEKLAQKVGFRAQKSP